MVALLVLGRGEVLTIRPATREDEQAISALMALAIAELQKGYLSPEQIEARPLSYSNPSWPGRKMPNGLPWAWPATTTPKEGRCSAARD